MPGSQEGEITAASPTPTTAPTMSKLSATHHNTAPQAPSHPAEPAASVGTATRQSPETTAAHSTAFNPSFPGTTKSSAMTGDSPASPKHTQSSDPGAGACALDEYPVSQGVCMCNESYYAHSELSRALVTLHCWPQNIEVVLNSCFLETRHWVLTEGTFSGCSSISKIEQGRHVHVFMMEKKEGTCGLHLSTNSTHALYSLEVQLLQVPPNFTSINSTMLSFSCTYPLVVNISQTQPYPVVSFPTIHIPGAGDIIVNLGIFTDPQLSTPLEDRTVPLGMPLYVVLRATSSDPDRFALVANEVFASTNISKTGSVKATHHFVNNSCPVSNRLLQGLRANGVSLEVSLAFTLFRFLTSDTLYLHGRVTLCDKQAGRPCQPTCSRKNPPGRNRAWEIRAREGLERGGGWMVFGPIRISGPTGPSKPRKTWLLLAARQDKGQKRKARGPGDLTQRDPCEQRAGAGGQRGLTPDWPEVGSPRKFSSLGGPRRSDGPYRVETSDARDLPPLGAGESEARAQNN
ncbi:PREDICTED: pancreatic secretory granule membrane major glycoprotein GP2-like [Galeopterus variegatus]|uniref:Pancreatic secretory granule membrane major glycoprotein GP2-like n=1 Tax=Galeopterus variegatus TaxID=482537 RepID=A0ABM0Q774_GALVR|nr:PREDICTED: pancreatic secretory granule membrane major glycoprotein GP2-like [Galeopterus variegatus]